MFFDSVTQSKFSVFYFLFEVLNKPAHVFLWSESLFCNVLKCFFKFRDCVVLKCALQFVNELHITMELGLKVHGMSTKFFLVYCIILAVLVLFSVGFLTNAMSGEGSFLAFIVALVVCALLSVFLRVLFINLSMVRRFRKFRRQVFVISNKDLLHSPFGNVNTTASNL